jgi:hypothetical protein
MAYAALSQTARLASAHITARYFSNQLMCDVTPWHPFGIMAFDVWQLARLLLVCLHAACGAVPMLQYGSFQCIENILGSKCTASCDYVTEAGSSVFVETVCQSDGTWSMPGSCPTPGENDLERWVVEQRHQDRVNVGDIAPCHKGKGTRQ